MCLLSPAQRLLATWRQAGFRYCRAVGLRTATGPMRRGSASSARAWHEHAGLPSRRLASRSRRSIRVERHQSPTVIGVVADTRHAPHLPPDRIVYRAVAQDPPPWLYLIVRARPGAPDPIKELKEAVWRVNPDQPIDGPWSVAEWVDSRTVHLRFLTLVSVVLGGVGVVLAAAGLYGLTAWSVASSRRSIAVRRAIGASDGQIRSWFVSRWARVVLPGIAGGWYLQSVWTSALVSAIDGLQAPGFWSVLGGISVMALSATAAAFVPLRRALATESSSLMR